MQLETAEVLRHDKHSGEYRTICLRAPRVAAAAKPGMFLHLRVPGLGESVLRRPFSICLAEDDCVAILYKQVGKGTRALASARPGTAISIVGPLGNGYPLDPGGTYPLLIAGGYGVAPLGFLARALPTKGTVFVGAATKDDVLCLEVFESAGWPVVIATEDGSAGRRGLVTDLVDTWLADRPADTAPSFYACGPTGMLRAIGKRAIDDNWTAWLSLERHMGCGVGVCLACVQKTRAVDGTVKWSRVCKDGPVFEAREVVWDDED